MTARDILNQLVESAVKRGADPEEAAKVAAENRADLLALVYQQQSQSDEWLVGRSPPEILARVAREIGNRRGSLAELTAHFRRVGMSQPLQSLPADDGPVPAPQDARPDTAVLLDLEHYDKILVGFSGGKDSVACTLHLIEQCRLRGIDFRQRIELWHHCVDGAPGSPGLLDWPCTEAYCRSFADMVGLPLLRSWRDGGFLRELRRRDSPTAPVTFERPDGGPLTTGGRGPAGTRERFPQVSADLSVRWCSAYLKIMVAGSAIANDPRFERDIRLLVVTGERRAESANRARYPRVELHRSAAPSKGRLVHQYRPVLDWSDARVWHELRRHGVVAHPCYYLGFGRASCETCIFSRAEEWATIEDIHPDRLETVSTLERWTGQTIHRKLSVPELARRGASRVPPGPVGCWWQQQAVEAFDAPIIVNPSGWTVPTGAFGPAVGPV